MFLSFFSSRAERNKQLRLAAASGDAVAVHQWLVRGGAAWQSCNPHGLTALHIAVVRHHETVVRVILQHAAKLGVAAACCAFAPDSRCGDHDTVGVTALHIAVAQHPGSKTTTRAIVQLLLQYNDKRGIDCARKDDGMTALHIASHAGHETHVQALLQAGADPRLRRSKDGATALWLACERGHGPVVRLLLLAHDDNADNNVNDDSMAATTIPNHTGQTPLYIAIARGHASIVWNQLVPHLQAKHDGLAMATLLWQADEEGWTPLHELCRRRHDHDDDDDDDDDESHYCMVRSLLQWLQHQQNLLTDASQSRTRFLDVTEPQHGWTPLHVAAAYGQGRMVRRLLHAGARLDIVDQEGLTPVHNAVQSSSLSSLDLIYRLVRHHQGLNILRGS